MRKITSFLLALCLLLSCPMTVFAAGDSDEETAGSTVITTVVPSTHTLTVSAENAEVSYNGETGTSFEVPRLEEFTFTVKAADGYLISKILLDGKDVTESFSEGTLTLRGIYEAAELTVVTLKVSGILYDIPEQELPYEDAIYKAAIEIGGLTEVPEALKDNPELDTVEKIEAALKTILAAYSGYPEKNMAIYDVTLVVSFDGGKTWEKASEESFPKNGLTVVLPYPEDTGMDTHNFAVTHMFTSTALGKTPGDTENLEATKTADGIQITVTGLSPVAVAWETIGQSSGGTQTESETTAQSDTESESETTAQSEPESESETVAQGETETESETAAQSETESETTVQSETVTQDESETESESTVQSESESETAAQSESETENETAAQSDTESETETAAQSESETDSKPSSQSETAAATESETEAGSVQTGDDTPIGQWMTLLMISGVIILSAGASRRRKYR
ncbi:MAG: hypothetical protein LUD12_15015 [Lachnospiraceae bacterium]|nr:hypothetical protein [Lachnospiraceae bacterium]